MGAGLDKKIISILIGFLTDVIGIYRFGSAGTAFARPDSDIDIAVLLSPGAAKKVDSKKWRILREKLESEFHTSVDLINLRQVDTVFQNEIVTNGRCIYCSDEFQLQTYEMLSLSFYQKLNEERAEILQDIINTGRILSL